MDGDMQKSTEDTPSPVVQLGERSREIFRQIVEAYVETGEPIGSRTLARRSGLGLSPATIRNAMADLEELGLLYAPHTSAGRLPTEAGLRLFVDGLLELGNLTSEERRQIEAQCAGSSLNVEQVLEDASAALSGLSRCAGLVLAPKTESALRHIEFVNLGPGRALVVLVAENGMVENRIIDVPLGLPPSALIEGANYLNARLAGRTLAEARAVVMVEIDEYRTQLDELTQGLVEAGLASWAGGSQGGSLIVRGQANLLSDITAVEDLERIRALFQMLETKEGLLGLLHLAEGAEGVQIFIGADNALFGLAGCSLVVAPYAKGQAETVGAIGVIGPTRINYARIIPMVDYTARLVGRLIG